MIAPRLHLHESAGPAIKAVYKIAPNSGDQGGVLDQVFAHDEGDAVDHDPAPAAPVDDAPRQTRAAAAVKAAAPPPCPPN